MATQRAFSLSKRSRERLAGVHPELVRVVTRAIATSAWDFMVTEGVRTLARQRELYAQGRTKPGRIVTWSMNSRHLKQQCGHGCAVDLAPWPLLPNSQVDWNNTSAFLAIGRAMLNASIELGIPIRWGWDWDRDARLSEPGESDGPHFELLRARYP